jgi:hypothetical protein
MTGKRDAGELRSVIAGLLGYAAAEEQVLLAASHTDQPGTPLNWAAAPLVAHNTEFKAQQAHRLQAITLGRVPREFPEIDHASEQLYLAYAAQRADRVTADSNRVIGELIAGLMLVSSDDKPMAERPQALAAGRCPWILASDGPPGRLPPGALAT